MDIASAMEPMPEGDKYDVIHFLYSGGITKQRKYFLKYKDKVFTSLASQRTLDFMFDKKESLVEIFQNSQGTVCHNTILHRKLLELIGFGYSDKVVYIPNGVDTELFNRKFTAGFVCAKGSNQHKGIHLARKACRELGIEPIEAHDWDYGHEEMPQFYRKIDCLIIPSLSEGCNNPTLGALAMNKPVISTPVGIALRLEGVTIVERDVESIKKALRKLSGRIQILEKYTWDAVAAQYRALYVKKS